MTSSLVIDRNNLRKVLKLAEELTNGKNVVSKLADLMPETFGNDSVLIADTISGIVFMIALRDDLNENEKPKAAETVFMNLGYSIMDTRLK